MPSGPRLVRRNKNICLCPIIFTGLVSPTGGNHRKSKKRASEEEAVNAMKWKQLKEGEREGRRTEQNMSVCHCHCWPAPQLLISPKHNNTIGQWRKRPVRVRKLLLISDMEVPSSIISATESLHSIRTLLTHSYNQMSLLKLCST